MPILVAQKQNPSPSARSLVRSGKIVPQEIRSSGVNDTVVMVMILTAGRVVAELIY